MFRLAALALILATPALAQSGGVSVIVQRVAASPPYAGVVVEVQNKTARRIAEINISCAVFNAQEAAIGASNHISMNVAANDSAFEQVLVPLIDAKPDDAKSARCRLVGVR